MHVYREFAFIPRGPTQQKPWRSCWWSRPKTLIKIILNWNTNMAAVWRHVQTLYTYLKPAYEFTRVKIQGQLLNVRKIFENINPKLLIIDKVCQLYQLRCFVRCLSNVQPNVKSKVFWIRRSQNAASVSKLTVYQSKLREKFTVWLLTRTSE